MREKYGLWEYEEQEERIEEMLTEDGYEILSRWISNYSADAPFFEWYDIEDDTICDDSEERHCYSDKVGVYVNMKSLGNRNEQVWDVLIVMRTIYPNAFTYKIDILSPTDKCEYLFFGDLIMDYFENYDSETRELIDDYIDNLACS